MAVSRRSLLKGISLTSVMSAVPSLVKAAPKASPGPYEQLGIRPVVNFQGTIDEVRVYNRALSQTEIQADMNVPVTP